MIKVMNLEMGRLSLIIMMTKFNQVSSLRSFSGCGQRDIKGQKKG